MIPRRRRILVSAAFLTVAACLALLAPDTALAGGPYQFYSVTPCRIADTRNPNGTFGGPALAANTARNYPIRNTCGIPLTAQAVVFNFTIVQAAAAGNLIVYPAGGSVPNTSVLNWAAGEFAVGNGAIIPLAGSTNDITVFPNEPAGAPVLNLVIDATGYFQ
jgi:hypothetical protein